MQIETTKLSLSERQRRLYQVISITGRPLSRKNVRLCVGTLQLRVGHLHEETIHLLVLAYNLIQIREGDEWKTAFVSPTGHYEYYVMPYGLVHAPSVFQDFMYDVLPGCTLVYSRSIAEHRHYVAEVLKRWGNITSFSRPRSAHSTKPQCSSLVITSTKMASKWTRGRSPPLRTGPFLSHLKNFNAS